MIYQVHYLDDATGSHGFAYFTNASAAQQALRAWQQADPAGRGDAAIRTRPTPKTVPDMLALLARWAAHPDNSLAP